MKIDTLRSVAAFLEVINPNFRIEAEERATLRVRFRYEAITEIYLTASYLKESLNLEQMEVRCSMKLPKGWEIEDNILYGELFGVNFMYNIRFESK